MQNESVFEYVKNLVLTVGWCVMRKTQLGSESNFPTGALLDSESDSQEIESKSTQNAEKSAVTSGCAYRFLADQEEVKNLIRSFTELICFSAFNTKSEIILKITRFFYRSEKFITEGRYFGKV